MKIRPVEAELHHANGQGDMTKLIVAFCNFTNAPQILYPCWESQPDSPIFESVA